MVNIVILAAGKGSRANSHTKDKPKCLIDVAGKPILHHQLDLFADLSIQNICIVTGYLAEKLDKYPIKKIYNPNYSTSNMLASLFSAKSWWNSCEDLIICYGDIVFQRENLEKLLACSDDISIIIDEQWLNLWRLRFEDPLCDAETLVVDRNDFIIELGRQPKTYEKIHAQYTGLIKVSGNKISKFGDFFEALDHGQKYFNKHIADLHMTDFFQLLIDAAWKIRGVRVKGGWLEVDTESDVALYNNLYQKGELDSFFKPLTET